MQLAFSVQALSVCIDDAAPLAASCIFLFWFGVGEVATRLQLSETKHEGTLGVLHAVRTFARHGSEETGRLGERGSRGIFLSTPRD